MNFKEINIRIREFEASEEYLHLMSPNFLEIAGKARSETAFSALFGWTLTNKKFERLAFSPVKSFLLLLKERASEQEKAPSVLMDEKVKKVLESDKVEIEVKGVRREYPVYETKTINRTKKTKTIKRTKKTKKAKRTEKIYVGKVDIIIICEFKIKGEISRLSIVVENKIDSKEGQEQCKKYYDCLVNNKEFEIMGRRYSTARDVDPLFVYSSVEKANQGELSCDKFICITHQDIFEKVLVPLYNSVIGEDGFIEEKYYLKEYMSALTSVKTNGKPIVVDTETRRKLKYLYHTYQDIIDVVMAEGSGNEYIKNTIIRTRNIQEVNDKATREWLHYYYESNQGVIDSLMEEGCDNEEIIDAITERRKSNSIRYEIYFEDELIKETNQSHLLADLVVHFMQRTNATKENVDDLFSNDNKIGNIFIDKGTGVVNVEINGDSYMINNQLVRTKKYKDTIIRIFEGQRYKIIER